MAEEMMTKAAAMTNRGGLTKAQMTALDGMRLWGKYHVAGNPAVRALERRGLVQTNEHGCTVITDAGRAALSEPDHG